MTTESENSPYKLQMPKEYLAQSKNIYEFVESLSEIDQNIIWQLLWEVAAYKQYEANENLERARNGERSRQKNALQAHKSAQRIATAGRKIFGVLFGEEEDYDEDKPVTLSEIVSSPVTYGLKKDDIDHIENWLKIKFGYSASSEHQYGVTRIDQFRKYIAINHLEKGTPGTMLCFDLAGLKIFNSAGEEDGVGHEYGDAALKKVATVLSAAVDKIVNPQPEDQPNQTKAIDPKHLIGRKGDEFYVFIPGLPPEEVVPVINQFYRDAVDRDFLSLEVNEHSMSINSYWRATSITNESELNDKMIALDNAIETAKMEAINTYVQEVEDIEVQPIMKFALLIQSLRDKRIPESLITASIFIGFDVLKDLIEKEGPKDIAENLDSLIAMYSNPFVREKSQQITREALLNEERNITKRII